MTDPMISAARELLKTALGDLRPAIEGATADAINWRPGGDDTNSIAVLITHAMHSTRMWLTVATGAPLPPRDRDAEFQATAPDADALLAIVDHFGAECDALLTNSSTTDWGQVRPTHPRPRPGVNDEVTTGWALVHAIEHLREHVGQTALTRQLVDQRTG